LLVDTIQAADKQLPIEETLVSRGTFPLWTLSESQVQTDGFAYNWHDMALVIRPSSDLVASCTGIPYADKKCDGQSRVDLKKSHQK
jgi:hypothetical protein